MKFKLIIILGIFTLALSAGIIYKTVISGKVSSSKEVSSSKDENKYEKKLSNGTITISLQPVQVTDDTVKFKLAMNTHSVSLEKLDLKKIISLETNNIEIHPVEVPSFTFHHGNGIIIFKLKNPLKKIKVIIRDVPDVSERIFKWSI